jgi:maltooligosyltrehalose synthase
MRRATRRLVRHQANWFREADTSIRWITPAEGYEAAVVEWVRGAIARDSV